MIDTEEAARRLGVKVNTIYAYVSRGLLPSQPAADGRRSLFEEADIARLERRSRGVRAISPQLVPVATQITELTDAGPVYRSRLATELAVELTFEEVAALLWSTTDGPWQSFQLAEPPELRAGDLLHWIVVMSSAANPLRSDLRAESVTRSARRLVATLVDVLPSAVGATGTKGAGKRDTSVAGRLAARLSSKPTSPTYVAAVNAALVLYADHEIGQSTLAVRIAASVRSSIYDAILAGLATLTSTLGMAAGLAYALLRDAELRGTRPALDEVLRHRGVLPGFGRPSPQVSDPRALLLLSLVEPLAAPGQREIINQVIELTADHDLHFTLDFAVAALMFAMDMHRDASQAIFAISRCAGWTAHYLEELEEVPHRFRRLPTTEY